MNGFSVSGEEKYRRMVRLCGMEVTAVPVKEATFYSIKDKSAFDKDALFYGEDLENITLEGRGTIDGQGEYEWRLNDIRDDFIRPNQELMEALGKPLIRSFPKKNQFGKMILLLRCKDVRISDLSLVRSPSWTIHPYGCERMVIDGVISNVTIECKRHDWFWWGDGDPFHFNIKRRSEVHPQIKWENEPPAGSIRNVLIKNVIAHGKGSSVINGHPDNWLDGITFENIKLFLSTDTAVAYDKAVHAFKFQMAKNLRLRNVEVFWERPESKKWESALYLEDVKGLLIDGFSGRQAKSASDMAAVALNRVEGATLRDCHAQNGTGTFLHVMGESSNDIYLFGNDFRRARTPYQLAKEVQRDAIQELSSIVPAR